MSRGAEQARRRWAKVVFRVQQYLVMVSYKLKADQVETNLRLLREFHQELESTQPEGVRISTFQLADGVSFVHLHAGDRPERFHRLDALERFRAGLASYFEEMGSLVSEGKFSVFDDRGPWQCAHVSDMTLVGIVDRICET